jgi:phosphate transport system substrate-binding protein
LNPHRRRTRVLLSAPLALVLVVSACGDDDDDSGSAGASDATTATTAASASTATTAAGSAATSTPETGTATTAASEGGGATPTTRVYENLNATLNASGATFPAAFYQEAIAEFQAANDGVTTNYAGGGSGKGRQDLADELVDFAGSDGLVKDEDRGKFKGGEFLYFPTVAAPITVSYNLDGVDGLQLSASTLAKIFQAEITSWNDPAIAADNPDAELPDEEIIVAHRADGSGTTENFTKFLVAAAGADWKLGSGSTVEWPPNTQAGQGNAGVAQIVSGTSGAIGYVDFSDAKVTGLSFASVENAAGNFIAPSLEASSAALEGATINADLSYNPLNASGADTYPIVAPTWILVYKDQADKAKGEATAAFLQYVLTDGQELAEEVDYARLPDELRERALAQLEQLVIPSA